MKPAEPQEDVLAGRTGFREPSPDSGSWRSASGGPKVTSKPPAVVPAGEGGALEEGAVVGGRFQVITRLGKGGMGEVFLAFDKETKQQVALKTVVGRGAQQGALLEALKKEVAAARGLPAHPNLLRVLDLEFRNEPPFYTMEYAGKGDLAELWMKKGRRLPADEVKKLLSQVLSALGVLHEAGVVHQDVKPQNVLMMVDGTPKLTDFGISNSLKAQLEGGRGDGAGTLLYMAPEQLRGEVCDPTVDLYACGIMAVQLLTGAYPFKGTSEAEVTAWHEGGTRDFAHLPAPFDTLVPKLVAVRPEGRPSTAKEVLALLEGAPKVQAPAAPAPVVKPNLPDESVDDAWRQHQTSTMAVLSDPYRTNGPLAKHPDNMLEELAKLRANQFFEGGKHLTGIQAMHRSNWDTVGKQIRARFGSVLRGLEKWAFHYPQYRGEYLDHRNHLNQVEGKPALAEGYFTLPDVVAMHTTPGTVSSPVGLQPSPLAGPALAPVGQVAVQAAAALQGVAANLSQTLPAQLAGGGGDLARQVINKGMLLKLITVLLTVGVVGDLACSNEPLTTF